MSRLRDNSSSAVNFFFLLDIFTCTLGVMILVTLYYGLHVQPRERYDVPKPLEGEATEILQPGEVPPEIRLSQLADLLFHLRWTNNYVQELIGKANELPELTAQSNSFNQLTLDNIILIVNTNDAVRRLEATEAQVDQFLKTLGMTNTADRIAMLEEKLASVSERIRNYEQTNDCLRAEIERIVRDPRVVLLAKSDKTPMLVTVSGSDVTVEVFGKARSRRELPAPVSNPTFIGTLAQLRGASSSSYVIFFVRPSGIPLYRRLYEATKTAGYEIGVDGVEENVRLTFARKG